MRFLIVRSNYEIVIVVDTETGDFSVSESFYSCCNKKKKEVVWRQGFYPWQKKTCHYLLKNYGKRQSDLGF